MSKDHDRPGQIDPSPPANDNGGAAKATLDPRIIKVAEALGRLLARRDAKSRQAANDNRPKADLGGR